MATPLTRDTFPLVLQSILLLTSPILVSPSSSDVDQSWTHSLVLDAAGKFRLSWTPEEERIKFKIEAETLGFVSVGFSPGGGMRGADIFTGWVDDETGEVFGQDRHATGNFLPPLDDSQDCDVLWGSQNGSHTSVAFSRKWDTCDAKDDLVLGGDTVRAIWAYGEGDGVGYHGRRRRGSRSVYLKEEQAKRIEMEPGIKTWDLLADDLLLPGDDHTHYWCRLFRAPRETSATKHHMVGFEPVVQPGHEGMVHHMVLYECHVDGDGDEEEEEEWFGPHIGGKGERCYSPNMPEEWNFCLATNTWAWAVGHSGETLPPHVGIPLGSLHGGASYFLLETHYDRPMEGARDSSGIRIFYTDSLRENDAAMMLLGSEVNFMHAIPPRQSSFRTFGRCSSECTSLGLPSTGVRLLSAVLHSHLAGRGVRLRHVRGGKERPVVFSDDSYDFNFQASRRPDSGRERLVLPGDELIVQCEYDTKKRDNFTFGGLSTREEMCLAFVLYYPRSRLADCRSLPSASSFLSALGVERVRGGAFQRLAEFLGDIGQQDPSSHSPSSNSSSLEELLVLLSQETGIPLPSSSSSSSSMNSHQPLTEQDILEQPFYTVVHQQQQEEGQEQHKDYRTLIREMLLSLRVSSPSRLKGISLGKHMRAGFYWEDRGEAAKAVGRILRTGPHSQLCLAHGRKPIIPYEVSSLPRFRRWREERKSTCGKSEEEEEEEEDYDHDGDWRRPLFLKEDDKSGARDSVRISFSFAHSWLFSLSLRAISLKVFI